MTQSFALYIHIPWCIQKCPYCDFNSHEAKGSIPEQDYTLRLLEDFNQHYPEVQDRELSSIFIGGGTPSLFHPEAIEKIIKPILERCQHKPNIEITMEANPGTLEHYPFIELHKAGVNRLSIGAQSFSNHQLKQLGRIHRKEAIEQSVQEAINAGFQRINIDIMYGLVKQSTQEALDDLKQAIALQPEHISWYQLTLEPNTAFHHRKPKLPTDDTLLSIFHEGQHLLSKAGYKPYEISAYTKDKMAAHNRNYWLFGDYVGIGAGAHSKISHQGQIKRSWNHKHPKRYLSCDHFQHGYRVLKQSDLEIEYLMNRLRLYQPLSKAEYEQHTGQKWKDFLKKIQDHDFLNWVLIKKDRVTISPEGRVMIDEILSWFV